jgi:hypothetical protein
MLTQANAAYWAERDRMIYEATRRVYQPMAWNIGTGGLRHCYETLRAGREGYGWLLFCIRRTFREIAEADGWLVQPCRKMQ